MISLNLARFRKKIKKTELEHSTLSSAPLESYAKGMMSRKSQETSNHQLKAKISKRGFHSTNTCKPGSILKHIE
jgi:hypothetical protein